MAGAIIKKPSAIEISARVRPAFVNGTTLGTHMLAFLIGWLFPIGQIDGEKRAA